MGWGAASPVVIYGFDMADYHCLFDYDYIDENFPAIRTYATGVSNGFFIEALYGMECDFDQETGRVSISERKKKEVMKLFNKYTAHLKSTLSPDIFERKMKCITLGFHRALTCDLESSSELTYITMTANEDIDKFEESEEEMDDDDGSSEEEGEEFEVKDDEDEDKDNDASATEEEATDATEDQQEPAAKRKKAAEDEENETH